MLVHVDASGRAVKVEGDPDQPVTAGFLCGKVSDYPARVYSEERLLHPLVRTGPKGSGSFRQASWDEALDRVAEGLQGAIDRHGGESILPYSYYGTMGLVQANLMSARVMNALGATNLERTICATAGMAGTIATHGLSPEVDPELWPRARYLLVWGWNPMSTAPHLWRLLLEAKRAGAKLVVVDPARSKTARVADEHLRPLPGGDGALAMGMMRAVLDAGLADEAWCREHADGFDDLVERVGERTVDEWAQLCGVPAEDVSRVGREFASTQPALLRLGVGAQRHRGRPGRVLDGCVPARAHRRLAPRGRRLLVHPDGHRRRGERRARPAHRPAARRGAHDQHVAARRRAHRPRARPAGGGARGVVLEPRSGRPAAAPRAGGPAPRGPVLRGARAVHDRHRGPRRRGAAGHHPARAHRRRLLLGPPLPHLERGGDRAAGRGALELRHLPRRRRAHGPRRPLLRGDRRGDPAGACWTRGPRASPSSSCARGASPRSTSARARRRTPRAASSPRAGSCRWTPRAGSPRPRWPTRSWPSASRWR